MHMTASEIDNALVSVVEDRRIDAAVAMHFKDRMVELVENRGERVILDLSIVEFLDCSGLGAVVGSMKQLGRDRRLDLAGLTPTADKVFRITRMDRVFRIYDDTEAAVKDVTHAS